MAFFVWAKALANSTGTIDEEAKGKESKKEKAEKKASEKGRIHYQLEKYDDHQLENWKSSKRIVVYQNDQQFRKFIEDALNNTTTGKIYFGKVSEDLASRIENETGLKTEGLNLSLSAYEIRKILLNSHGNESIEALRGQRAIIADDLLLIPDVISEPDTIIKDAKLYNGAPVLKFQKNIDGWTVIVTYISTKHGDLAVQTMYGGIKNRSLATPSNAAANAAPYSVTSKTSRGTASTDSSIAQTSDKINTQNSEGKAKYQLTEDQLETVRSENFKKWFGDWENDPKNASKIVNPDGTPEIVYHGTNADFTTFERGDIGFHVGTKEQAEDRIADSGEPGHVMSLYASIKKPLYAAFDFGDWHGNNVAEMLIETEQFEDNPDREAIEEELGRILQIDDVKTSDNELRKYLQSLGYDGIMYENTFEGSGNELSYIAFESSQLKSAEDNVGTFNKSNPDIRYQLQEDNPYDWLADDDEDLEEINYDENGVAYPGDEDVPQ